MDIYCPKCGEPIEIDALHERAEELTIEGDRDWSFEDVRKAFYSTGCEALGMTHNAQPRAFAASASAALMEMLGDDIDGVGSMLGDFEYMGWLGK